MKVWLERVAYLQILNRDSATKFDAVGRSAETFPLVHVFSATYIRMAHLQRHPSAKYTD